MDHQDGTARLPEKENPSDLKIADEVVAIIAGIAATDVPGVAAMAGGVVGGIAERLGVKNLQRGVKVEVGNTETAIDIFIIVDYGVRIPEVAQKVQEEVRQAVESMTGLTVVEVNVHIQGVSFEAENSHQEASHTK